MIHTCKATWNNKTEKQKSLHGTTSHIILGILLMAIKKNVGKYLLFIIKIN